MMRWMLTVLLAGAAGLVRADGRGLKVLGVRTSDGQDVPLYDGSHALLVGVSDYRAGWPQLPNVPQEIAAVEAVLKASGFSVTKVIDPDDTKLVQVFREFIHAHGYDPGARLLFFYSGHGWSRKGGDQGYLVPVNAPDPTRDEKGFLRTTLTMSQILAWCKEMESRHVLFLFDSCFSGTIFTAKTLPDHPPPITSLVSLPVRQFITAGDAGEQVPSRSVFTPMFIRGVEGEADLTGDGYVTGTELGLYLREKVLHYRNGQTPQYGKIRDPDLDRGDFVFLPLRHASGLVAVSSTPGPSSRETPIVAHASLDRSQRAEEDAMFALEPRVGVALATGVAGIEARYRQLAVAAGLRAPIQFDGGGPAAGAKYYLRRGDSWYVGVGGGSAKKEEGDTGMDKITSYIGGVVGYHWQWDSGMTLSVGLAVVSVDEKLEDPAGTRPDGESKSSVVPTGDVALGYRFAW